MSRLQELNKHYQELKEKGVELDCLVLDIHMPTDETEIIVNPNVEGKIQYINKTYNEDLIHSNCKAIYITDYTFVESGLTYDFSWALAMLKDGLRVRRKGWNGKGLCVAMQQGYSEVLANPHTVQAFDLEEGDIVEVKPYFQIKDSNNVLNTWVPSVSDLLAEDWEVVTNE